LLIRLFLFSTVILLTSASASPSAVIIGAGSGFSLLGMRKADYRKEHNIAEIRNSEGMYFHLETGIIFRVKNKLDVSGYLLQRPTEISISGDLLTKTIREKFHVPILLKFTRYRRSYAGAKNAGFFFGAGYNFINTETTTRKYPEADSITFTDTVTIDYFDKGTPALFAGLTAYKRSNMRTVLFLEIGYMLPLHSSQVFYPMCEAGLRYEFPRLSR